MVRKVRGLLVGTVLTMLMWAAEKASQAQELPPAPVPVVPSNPSADGSAVPPPRPLPPTGPVEAIPPPGYPPPVMQPYYAPYQDENGPLLRGDPLLDRPQSPPPGWFLALELDVLGPHIKNRLQAPVTIDDLAPNIVHLPTAELDWTGSPRFELGYRLPAGLGEFLVSYRFLVTEGTDTLFGFDPEGGDASIKSHLNVNVVDFDYSSREYSLDPHWDMKWKVGVRLATVFFDSLAEGVFVEERTSNHFVGAGPHVGLDLWRSLDVPGLGFFGRLEAAAPIGQISQGFEETIMSDDGTVLGAATTVHRTQAVPTLTLQAGLSWTPRWHSRSRFAVGYEFERWWYIGDAGDSHAELTTQGIFFRGEFAY